MKKSELYKYVLDYFRGIHPEVTTELEFGSVFQLLVAVVLSAQCTDKRVNQVTPELFAHYPDARSMAEADEFEVYEYVKSVSYPNAKARHLVELARMIQSEYGGEVPHDFDSLLRLPGVGYIVLGVTGKTLWLIVGNIISLLIAFILQFLFMNLDYARTERVQFEDDDYYYYVKAVPKKMVAVREVTVKHFGNTASMGKRIDHSRSVLSPEEEENSRKVIAKELDIDEDLLK